eukprot:m51a1_g10959 hypothetical protein (245) ;mRNA; r:217833-218567
MMTEPVFFDRGRMEVAHAEKMLCGPGASSFFEPSESRAGPPAGTHWVSVDDLDSAENWVSELPQEDSAGAVPLCKSPRPSSGSLQAALPGEAVHSPSTKNENKPTDSAPLADGPLDVDEPLVLFLHRAVQDAVSQGLSTVDQRATLRCLSGVLLDFVKLCKTPVSPAPATSSEWLEKGAVVGSPMRRKKYMAFQDALDQPEPMLILVIQSCDRLFDRTIKQHKKLSEATLATIEACAKALRPKS